MKDKCQVVRFFITRDSSYRKINKWKILFAISSVRRNADIWLLPIQLFVVKNNLFNPTDFIRFPKHWRTVFSFVLVSYYFLKILFHIMRFKKGLTKYLRKEYINYIFETWFFYIYLTTFKLNVFKNGIKINLLF